MESGAVHCFDGVLKAVPPALLSFLTNLPVVEGMLTNFGIWYVISIYHLLLQVGGQVPTGFLVLSIQWVHGHVSTWFFSLCLWSWTL